MSQTVINVDSQVLNNIQLCARKTKLIFIDQVVPLEKAEALERGSLLHTMLEIYYSALGHCINPTSDTWIELAQANLVYKIPETFTDSDYAQMVQFAVDAGRFFAVKMSLPADEVEETVYQFREYAEHFRHDNWHPLAVEETGCKLMYEDDALKITYSFKVDLVAEQGRIICPWDHKSSKRRQDPSSLSNQFIGYCYGLGVNHIMVNKIGFQKTLSRGERFQRDMLVIPDSRIEEWRKNSIWWISLLAQHMQDNHFPANFTSCDKYSGCIFRGVCEADPLSRPDKIERLFKRGESWDVSKALEVTLGG